jgi:hypothetical protein
MPSKKKSPQIAAAGSQQDVTTSVSNITSDVSEANSRAARRRALKERVARDLEMARTLLKRGWSIIPLKDRSKEPIPTWSSSSPPITFDNVHEFFGKEPRNIGVQLGDRSGGLVDVDSDSRWARQFFSKFLPESARCGRKSSPGSHRFYIASVDRALKLVDPIPMPTEHEKHEATHVELRIAGYTVCYGTHETTGEDIIWENDLEPVRVDGDWLKQQCRALAVTAMLKRHWPLPGGRHDAMAAVVGFLTRLGQADKMIAQYVTALNDDSSNKSERKHDWWATDSARRWEDDGRFYGIPTLLRVFPKVVVYRMLEWLDVGISRDVLEMNETYAMVWVGSIVVVLKESYDEVLGRNTTTFIHDSDMRAWHANRKVNINEGDEDAKPKYLNLYDYWKQSPYRREYKGVVFAPGEDISDYYNLWTGWNVEPSSTATCERYLQHLREVICGGNEEYSNWLIAWMADAVQHPNTKPGTAIILRGSEGVGKGFFVHYFGELYGGHYVQLLQGEHFIGRFNAHMKGAALVFADEAFFAGDKKHDGILKGLITEDTVIIEEKFKDAISVRNCMRLIMAANGDWVVPAGLEARRYFVLDVANTHAGDQDYFDALAQEKDNGGPAALMHFLMTYVIPDTINLRQTPKTQALMDQKHLTMSPAQRFMYERLMEGLLLPTHGEDEEIDWLCPSDEGRIWVFTKDLHEAFIRECQQTNARYRDSQEIFGKEVRRLFKSCCLKKRKTLEITVACDGPEGGTETKTKRGWAYGFSELDECRAAFEQAVKQSIKWPVDEKDEKEVKPYPF